MKNNLAVKHIHNLRDFEALKSSWEKLLEQNEINDVFLSWEWLTAWWKVYGISKELWLITVWKDNELTGCAPLMRVKKKKAGITYRILQTLGSPESDVGGFLIREGEIHILQVIFDYILEQSSRWDVLYLKEFKYETLQTEQILHLVESLKLRKFIKFRDHFYIPIKGEWDTYLRELSKNTRKNLARRRKRAEEAGKLVLERFRGSAIDPKHLEKIYTLSKLGNFPKLYTAKEDQDFHYELLTRMCDKDWIGIDILSINNKPAAYQYGFFYRNRYEDWQGSFDKTYYELSPGTLLLSLSLKHLFKEGYKEHDFLRGGYNYKMIWNSQSRKYTKIYIVAPNNLKAQVNFIWFPNFKRWLKSKLRRHS